MTDYIALRIDASPCSEDITDLLAAYLADIGYESFCADSDGLTAYIQADSFSESAVRAALDDFPFEVATVLTPAFVKGENWNEEWEKHYFQPIVIGDCVVHSTFHKDVPKARYDIIIDPKMAFGTGHHATTSLMLSYLLDLPLEGKSVIDMGTGTGILAILCMMRGASEATGIEIDEGAYDNALENVGLNSVKARMINSDASALADVEPADLFIANINRNVITSDIHKYASALREGGTMLLSGFYDVDIPVVSRSAEEAGLKVTDHREQDKWVALRLTKPSL